MSRGCGKKMFNFLRKKKQCKYCRKDFRKPWHLFLGEEFCSEKCFDEYVPTMEEENQKRISIGYPHLLRGVKEKCPKCKGDMIHDSFQKCIDLKSGHMKACYQCTKCGYRVLFDLTTKKFDKKPFGSNDVNVADTDHAVRETGGKNGS